MKFNLILIAVASAASIQQRDPNGAYTGRAENLKAGLEAVKNQLAFEAKHEAKHAAAMLKADQESRALQDKIH